MVQPEQELKTDKKKSFTLYSFSTHVPKAPLKTDFLEKIVTVLVTPQVT